MSQARRNVGFLKMKSLWAQFCGDRPYNVDLFRVMSYDVILEIQEGIEPYIESNNKWIISWGLKYD
jgi:hypothetical protein